MRETEEEGGADTGRHRSGGMQFVRSVEQYLVLNT